MEKHVQGLEDERWTKRKTNWITLEGKDKRRHKLRDGVRILKKNFILVWQDGKMAKAKERNVWKNLTESLVQKNCI